MQVYSKKTKVLTVVKTVLFLLFFTIILFGSMFIFATKRADQQTALYGSQAASGQAVSEQATDMTDTEGDNR